jgi:hypothetical protein
MAGIQISMFIDKGRIKATVLPSRFVVLKVQGETHLHLTSFAFLILRLLFFPPVLGKNNVQEQF